MAAAASASVCGAKRDLDFLRLLDIAPEEIDRLLVMERITLGAVLPVAFDWCGGGRRSPSPPEPTSIDDERAHPQAGV